jgi:hypothetical protein
MYWCDSFICVKESDIRNKFLSDSILIFLKNSQNRKKSMKVAGAASPLYIIVLTDHGEDALSASRPVLVPRPLSIADMHHTDLRQHKGRRPSRLSHAQFDSA